MTSQSSTLHFGKERSRGESVAQLLVLNEVALIRVFKYYWLYLILSPWMARGSGVKVLHMNSLS